MPDEVSDETLECEFCSKPQKNRLELEKHIAQNHIETFDSSDEEASKKSNEAVPDEVSDEICEVEDDEKRGTKSAIKCQKVPQGMIKVKPPSFFKKTITDESPITPKDDLSSQPNSVEGSNDSSTFVVGLNWNEEQSKFFFEVLVAQTSAQ